MVAAVRALEKQDIEGIEFGISEAKADENKALMSEQFPNNHHGLIAYDGSGAIAHKIEGHRFGTKEIMQVVKKVQ